MYARILLRFSVVLELIPSRFLLFFCFSSHPPPWSVFRLELISIIFSKSVKDLGGSRSSNSAPPLPRSLLTPFLMGSSCSSFFLFSIPHSLHDLLSPTLMAMVTVTLTVTPNLCLFFLLSLSFPPPCLLFYRFRFGHRREKRKEKKRENKMEIEVRSREPSILVITLVSFSCTKWASLPPGPSLPPAFCVPSLALFPSPLPLPAGMGLCFAFVTLCAPSWFVFSPCPSQETTGRFGSSVFMVLTCAENADVSRYFPEP